MDETLKQLRLAYRQACTRYTDKKLELEILDEEVKRAKTEKEIACKTYCDYAKSLE